MIIIITGITDEGLQKLKEIVTGRLNMDNQIRIVDFRDVSKADQPRKSYVEVSVPYSASRLGRIMEAISKHSDNIWVRD
jgi:hypothetical protein